MGRPNAASQRGNVGLYLLFSIAVATAAGYGVYRVLRERSRAEAAEAQVERPRVAPARSDEAEPTPVVDRAELAEPAVATDSAERDARLPYDIPDPAKDTVVLGTPGIAGALDAAQVDRTLKRYLVRYDRCMRHAHDKYRLRRGELQVTFVIAADGNVEYATGRPTNLEDELASCVVDVIKKLRFDKPTDGGKVKVVYPMRFVPARGGDAGNPAPADPWSDDPLGNR